MSTLLRTHPPYHHCPTKADSIFFYFCFATTKWNIGLKTQSTVKERWNNNKKLKNIENLNFLYFFVSSFPITCHLPKNYSLQLDCTSLTKVKKTFFFLQKIILLERNGEEKKQPDKQKQNEFQEIKKTLLKSFFPSLGQIRLISFYVSEDHLNKRTQQPWDGVGY